MVFTPKILRGKQILKLKGCLQTEQENANFKEKFCIKLQQILTESIKVE